MPRNLLLFPAGSLFGVLVGGVAGALVGLEHTGTGAIIGVVIGSSLGGMSYAYQVEKISKDRS